MDDNVSNYLELSDYLYFYYLIMYKKLITMNYIYTFGLTEGISPRVTCKQIPVSVNSIGVLFIYL
jgi:hypothetical protein